MPETGEPDTPYEIVFTASIEVSQGTAEPKEEETDS